MSIKNRNEIISDLRVVKNNITDLLEWYEDYTKYDTEIMTINGKQSIEGILDKTRRRFGVAMRLNHYPDHEISAALGELDLVRDFIISELTKKQIQDK